jgi:hypothetical protein
VLGGVPGTVAAHPDDPAWVGERFQHRTMTLEQLGVSAGK